MYRSELQSLLRCVYLKMQQSAQFQRWDYNGTFYSCTDLLLLSVLIWVTGVAG